ncbi:hypothetical protein F511_37509 [Dorcoceras hygrometricum]|uniref:Dystroglycan-like n=1 Tax=Dorcoceras hygrometricum TaxID=472368 RepID=A0A2Z7CTI1_9LAMI|nr:hypothetical protein F511_37509 [Dorcoceras hygrometricum]
MDDPGMVSMFEALVASGLRGFLGCPAVVYEDALVDFFENASVRNGMVISTVGGQLVEISEKLFAETFELPIDGLGDLSEMPKDAIFDARSIVSLSGEPISLSGRKNQMKMPFRLLCDIVAKAISVKAGSFNAITLLPVYSLEWSSTSLPLLPAVLRRFILIKQILMRLRLLDRLFLRIFLLCLLIFKLLSRNRFLRLRATFLPGCTRLSKACVTPCEIKPIFSRVYLREHANIQKDAEATKEALSHQLLEFQSSAQENHNVIHAQLSELVDYIHRGSADKKGESGSRGLQKPANTQKEGSAVTPSFEQRVQMTQWRIVQTVLDADANRSMSQEAAERDRERRRKEAKSLKRRKRD